MTRDPLEWRGRTAPLEQPEAPTRDDDWRKVDESGSVAAIRALIIAATMFGRPFARVIVRLVAGYYTLASSGARRSVNDFRRHLGLAPSLRATYRQVLRFAQCSLDALFFMRGQTERFRVTHVGHHHLQAVRDSKGGGILLGAHLGSFYAMRVKSAERSIPINPVVYTKNAQRFNAVIEALDPKSTTRLIEIGEGSQMDFILSIRERLDEGALIAILGDRVQPGGRTAEVDFLGGRIRLPLGPYFLAASLRRPVYFTAGIYKGDNHYELHCQPFAEQVVLPRGRREEAAAEYAQKYADVLADFCRATPDNWFNFFDFFVEDDVEGPS